MGFGFTLEKPHDGVEVPCAFSLDQMHWVRMIMIEAGVVAGGGFEASLQVPGLETGADTVPIKKFMMVPDGGGHITAHEAGFIAVRLRRATELGVIVNLLMFLDENPGASAVTEWVDEFAAFNERAAGQDGYYVR
jgi:hypothetical protein